MVAKCWGWGKELTTKYKGHFGGVIEPFHILIAIVDTWLNTFVKTHRNCTLKQSIFTVCKLYLNTKMEKEKLPNILTHFE